MSVQHFPTVAIPFNQLRKGKKNPRKDNNTDPRGMATSLKTVGQLQNLVVCDLGDGTYEVMAGNTRYDGFEINVNEGAVPSDFPVNCIICDANDQSALSAIENMQRKDMNRADEYDATMRMRDEGMSIDRIADVLGVTPLVVERRLRMSEVAPELKALFREGKGKISVEQLIALSATDDHTLQMSAWQNTYHKSPENLRAAVTATEIDAAVDHRVKFIGGTSAFIAAGGDVRRDMFSDAATGGFISDVALLDRLVTDKLAATAATVQAEGWAWVETMSRRDWDVLNRLGTIRAELILSDEDKASIAKLEAEDEQLEKELHALWNADESEDEEEREGEIQDRREAIEAAIEGIKDAAQVYEPEAKAYAGAVVILANGEIVIERGKVRAEDRKSMAKVNREVRGGRETRPAGRNADAISESLRRSLLGHRNIGAQLAVAANPRVAKILLACKFAADSFHMFGDVPCTLSGSSSGWGTIGYNSDAGAEGKAKQEELAAIGKSIFGSMRMKPEALWSFMADLSDADLDRVIAFGVAGSVSVDETHKGLTACLLDSLAFSVADTFTPTADNFFARAPKDFAVKALIETGKRSESDRDVLGGMKKGDLAKVAEAEVAGTGWVPEPIRGPLNRVPVAPKEKTAKPVAVKKAAGKAPAKGKAKPAPKAKPAAKGKTAKAA